MGKGGGCSKKEGDWKIGNGLGGGGTFLPPIICKLKMKKE